MHRDLVEACGAEGSREMTFGEVVVASAEDEPVKIETNKGYQLVMSSLEVVREAEGAPQGQGRAAVKEAEWYDWDKEKQVNSLQVMAGFDYEAIATMDVSANRNDPV
jgi:hypothetical protein